MQNHQTSPFDQPSQPFSGVRFVLFGFDPIRKSQVSRKLVDNGGVDAGQYGPNCTHVIVDKLTYDDPVCVTARRDAKKLVSSLWVEHSFDVGSPVKTTEIMYRPVKDLNGIPGAKSLVICLTGYQGVDREDIMTMVSLMGAQFSKPLIANKITHLICYKFEGEKYLLAKKMRIKLVNHKWLEDCLKAWEVVLEDDYSKSGYELELEAEAQDSEEKQEDVTRPNEVKIASKQEISRNLLNSAFNGFGNDVDTAQVNTKTKPDQFSNLHERNSNTKNDIGVNCEPSNSYEGLTSGSAAVNRNIYASTSVNKSPLNETNVNVPTRTTPPTMHTTTSNTSSAKKLNKLNFIEAFNESSSLVENFNEEQKCSSSRKRKTDSTYNSVKQQRTNHNKEASNRQIASLNDEVATSPGRLLPSKIAAQSTSSSRGKNVNVPITKTPTFKIVQGEDLVVVQSPMKEYAKTNIVLNFDNRDEGMEKNNSSSAAETDLSKSSTGAGSNSKPFKRKSFGKKSSASYQNLDKTEIVNQKGSIYLKNNEPRIDATASMADVGGPIDNEDLGTYKKYEKGTKRTSLSVNRATAKTVTKKKELASKSNERPEIREDTTQHRVGKTKRHVNDGEPEDTVDVMMEDITEKDQPVVDQDNDIDGDMTECRNVKNKVPTEITDCFENRVSNKMCRGNKNGKKGTADVSVRRVTDKTVAKKKKLVVDNDDGKSPVTEKAMNNVNDLENSMETKGSEDACIDPEHKNEEDDTKKKGTKKSKRSVKQVTVKKKKVVKTMRNDNGIVNLLQVTTTEGVCSDLVQKDDIENVVNTKANKTNKRVSKAKKDVTLTVKEVTNITVDQSTDNKQVVEKIATKSGKLNSDRVKDEPMWFILAGNKVQRREFQQMIRRLKGRVCKVSHQWSYQATHFIVPHPIRRTEKFFAAAASGRWIMKTDYLSASNQAGRFLSEEAYEWHKNGLSEDGQINLEAPRKWRLLKEKTGHGAFYGMRLIIYGECIAPPLDTLKRVVKAGDGTILATSPPYSRFLNTGVDFAVVSPGMPHVDVWVQEFLRHEIPCVSADYLVEYVCKPGYSLDKHILYNTNVWAERSFNNLQNRLKEEATEPITPDSDDVACEVCGSRDRGDEMLICGDESGSIGCGVGTHFDCCDPPLDNIPDEDWFCPNCIKTTKKNSKRKGK